MNVLLLEDDDLFSTVIQRMCARENFSTVAFSNPAEFLISKVSIEKIDILIIDEEMPYMKGINFLRLLKDKNLLPKNVIYFTSNGDAISKALKEGLVNYSSRKSISDMNVFLDEINQTNKESAHH